MAKKKDNIFTEMFKLPREKMEEQKKVNEPAERLEAEKAKVIKQTEEHPRPRREVGSVYLSLQAQKIYNPNTPQVSKPVTKHQINQGLADDLDTSGHWGKPSEEKIE